MKNNKKVNKSNKKILITAPFIAVLLLGAYFVVSNNSDSTNFNESSTVTKIEFKDGSYEESVSYPVPKSTNTLKAKITIKNDIVTEISTSHTYTNEKSKEYLDPFDKEISSAVVGKKVKDIDLDILGGASLTSEVFNELIESVLDKAK
jgi:uncharacterized protein with FMN-binding domain